MNWTEDDVRHRGFVIERDAAGFPVRMTFGPVASRAAPTRQARPGRTLVAPVALKGFDPFVALLEAEGLPAPETEAEFIEGRKFRADYLWRPKKVIVEQNGQIWKKGGHSSGTGLLRDYEKANLANAAGWCYLTFTPKQLASGECLPLLRILLA